MAADIFQRLLSSTRIGELELPNRIVMAPMTRSWALPGGVPGPRSIDYYRERAGAGLIITEAAAVSPAGHGAADTPGLYDRVQADGWRAVTQAVHEQGGRIMLQLAHAGRLARPSGRPGGPLPVAPSAEPRRDAGAGPARGAARALGLREISALVDAYRAASERARAAGFDGVEIDAGGGHLIDQFLRRHSNRRTDRYGGSTINRPRLLLEVLEATIPVFGAGRVGVRLSPYARLKGGADPADADLPETYAHVVDQLNNHGLAYLTIVGSAPGDGAELRARYRGGAYMANGGYTPRSAEKAIADGFADLAAFGPLFIPNPDLPLRLAGGEPLAESPINQE